MWMARGGRRREERENGFEVYGVDMAQCMSSSVLPSHHRDVPPTKVRGSSFDLLRFAVVHTDHLTRAPEVVAF